MCTTTEISGWLRGNMGVTIIKDNSPEFITFKVDYSVLPRITLIEQIMNYDLWIKKSNGNEFTLSQRPLKINL